MGRKRTYTRRGPVGVLAQNVAAVTRHAHLAARRLDDWGASQETLVLEAGALALQVLDGATQLVELVGKIAESGFVPPARAELPLQAGELLAVKAEHRGLYEARYEALVREDPKALDGLVVERVLETGDVMVRRGRRAPFPARKSHLARVKKSEEV